MGRGGMKAVSAALGMVLLFIAFLNYIVFLWEENMNHIYKVIWSRVKNSYVVVSEIAGTARKSGGGESL